MAAGTAAALLVAACGSSAGSASSEPAAVGPGGQSATSASSLAGQTITLYNGQHEQTTDALVQAFKKQTGVKVKVSNDDEDVLAQQIEQEGSQSPADVFFTENTPPLARLDEKGLLAPIGGQALTAVPAKYSADDKDWVGVSARVSVLVYNTDKLKPSQLPKSVLDLANPEWKGKLDIAPAETDFAPIVTSVAQDKGDAAAVELAEGAEGQRGIAPGPGQRDAGRERQQGHDRDRRDQPLLLVPAAGTRSAQSGMHSALAYFAPR